MEGNLKAQPMIFEGEYFYKGVERLSWGFGSPNQLGALFACSIPFAWCLMPTRVVAVAPISMPKSKRIRAENPPVHRTFWPRARQGGALGAELALWVGLGATASRGAAVAALGAAFAWSVGRRFSGLTTSRSSSLWFGLRVAMCVAGLAVCSFGGRIAPDYLARDASIGNRFILWSGAVRLIASAPRTGWGVGESGNAFMQWVQPLDQPDRYRTPVNSFLHVGVERGLPTLGIVLFLTFVGAGWAFACERYIKNVRIRNLVRASSCVILSWALSNVFSTLFQDWRLWIFPAIASVILLGSSVATRAPLRLINYWIGCALGAAATTCFALWLLGARTEAAQVIHLGHPENGVVMLSRGHRIVKPQWALLNDPSVLGKLYGQEIRRWGYRIADSGLPWSVAVIDGRFWNSSISAFRRLHHWILIGVTAKVADTLGSNDFVVFLHPRGRPPETWHGRGTVIFNGIDEEGSHEAWMEWAVRRHLQIKTVASVGLDARAAWPDAYIPDLVATP